MESVNVMHHDLPCVTLWETVHPTCVEQIQVAYQSLIASREYVNVFLIRRAIDPE